MVHHHMMPLHGNWIFWALLSAAFAAATAVLAKVGLEGTNADFASLVRATFIVVLLLIFVNATGQWVAPADLTRRNWLFLALSALATAASWVCYFRALQLGNVAHVATIDKLSVVLVAIFAAAFLGERLTVKDWTGIALIAIGAILLASRRY